MENLRLEVETLGPLRVYAGGREVAVGPPKQRAMFAVLALSTNSLVSRDDLIDRLWDSTPPTTAAGSVHTYLSGLRQALSGLGEPLVNSGSGYTLQLDPEQVDARVVERLAAQARADRARHEPTSAVTAYGEALARWRPGSILGGLPGPFAVEYRAWASELRLRLLMERAELLLELDQPDTVADELRAHIAANPYDEGLRALLMTALRRSGRTADALAQYKDLRTVLAEELGIDPSAELQDLNSSILSDNVRTRTTRSAPPTAAATTAATTAAVTPAQLPRGVGDFVGRVAAVQEVLDAAHTASADNVAGEARSPQIVTIGGVGGVGKTALAVHCAHLLAGAFPDGQLYLNLRGFDPKHPPREPMDALHHLLTSMNAGTIPADYEPRAALWRSIVRDKRMLIVLDNTDSADRVEDLLPGGGPSFVVVTSRNRLSGLSVRYAARRVTLAPLTADESLKLLSSAIGPERIDSEPSAAQRLAELCGHLPLALRIASEQATTGSRSRIADLVADLENVRHRLDALQIPDDELGSVRGVLSWSYTRLDAEAAHVFRTLGLFPGVAIRPEPAGALLDVPPPAAAAALQNLAAQHLVEIDGGGYQMHDLTRIYAEEMSRDGETSTARRQALQRMLDWYVQTLTPEYRSTRVKLPFSPVTGTAHEPLRFDNQKEVVAWCVQEWDNIAPLVRTALQTGCHRQAWQLTYLLFDYFYAAGQAGEWVETLRLGIRSAEMIEDRRAQAALLNHLSVAYARTGDNDVAVQQLHRALRLLDSPDDDVRRISLLANLASTLREAKDYAGALPYADQALALARRSGLEYYEAGCLDVLSELLAELGRFEESLQCGTLGLVAARHCQDVLIEANILINLGVAEHGLGRAGTALRHFQGALSLSESSGDRYHEALALFGLAKVHEARPAHRPAHDLATRALRLLEQLGAEEVAEVTEFVRGLDAEPPSAGSRDSVRRSG